MSVCRAVRPASGVRSVTCVPETSSVCRAVRPASGVRSVTCVSETVERLQGGEAGQRRQVGDLRARDMSVCRAVRPASGARSATCVPETLSVCRAVRPASGARSATCVPETVERLQGGEAGQRREVGDLRARDDRASAGR